MSKHKHFPENLATQDQVWFWFPSIAPCLLETIPLHSILKHIHTLFSSDSYKHTTTDHKLVELVSPLQRDWICGWLYILRSVTAHWNMASLSEVKSLKKTGSPLGSYQLPLSLQWGGWFGDHLPSLSWICLAWTEFICELPDYVQNHGFVITMYDLCLLQSFCFLFHTGPWTSGREGCDINAPFMTEHLQTVTPQGVTDPDQLCVSVNSCINWESRFLWCTKQV